VNHRGECSRRFADRVKPARTPRGSWHRQRDRRVGRDTPARLSASRPRWFRGNRPCRPEYQPWPRDDRQDPLLPRDGPGSPNLPVRHEQPPRLGSPADRHAAKAGLTREQKLPGPAGLVPVPSPGNRYHLLRRHACLRTPSTEAQSRPRAGEIRRWSGRHLVLPAAVPPFDGGFPHMLHSTFQEKS
jgi:hypothetical protein